MSFLILLLFLQDPQVLSIKQGEPAPFDGFVILEDRFTKILEQDISVLTLQAELEMRTKLMGKVEEICWKELEKRTEKHWWETPYTNQVLGFVFGAVFSTAIYMAVR
jgi:hypothetical protein